MTRIVRAGDLRAPHPAQRARGLVVHHAAGAVVGFGGIVRNHDGGRRCSVWSTHAHPHAEQILFEILRGVGGGRPGVQAVAASHRVGRPEIGEAALVPPSRPSIVPRPSRRARFVDAVKERLPVWKHQFADGSDEWVNSA